MDYLATLHSLHSLPSLISVSAAAVLGGSVLLALGMARMARLTQPYERWER